MSGISITYFRFKKKIIFDHAESCYVQCACLFLSNVLLIKGQKFCGLANKSFTAVNSF